jgi:hypothetical protein
VRSSEWTLVLWLCEEASAGRLTTRDLCEHAPAADVHPMLTGIIEDIEDVVEHSPGRHTEHWNVWRLMEPWRILLGDTVILQLAESLHQAQVVRQRMLAALPKSASDIESAVRRHLVDTSGAKE